MEKRKLANFGKTYDDLPSYHHQMYILIMKVDVYVKKSSGIIQVTLTGVSI